MRAEDEEVVVWSFEPSAGFSEKREGAMRAVSVDLAPKVNGREVMGAFDFLGLSEEAPKMLVIEEAEGVGMNPVLVVETASLAFVEAEMFLPPNVKPSFGGAGIVCAFVTGAGLGAAAFPSKSFWISARRDLYRSRKTAISAKGSSSTAFPIAARKDSLRPRREV